MATLVIDTGTGSELTFEIETESVTVGASSDNDVVLRAPGVAPHHLVIRRSGDRFTFLAQQRQVVLVNGKRRARGVLGDGDRIRVGTATLSMRLEGAAADVSEGEAPQRAEIDPVAAPEAEPARPRSEMVVFTEPTRRAAARRRLLEVLRGGAAADLSEVLETYLETTFEGRRVVLSWLDQEGRLQLIVGAGRGGALQVPTRAFAELDRGDRFALLRTAGRQLLVHPVPAQPADNRVYLIVETGEAELEEDRNIVGEVVAVLAARWQDIADSSAILGQWEHDARAKTEARVPGTSASARTLREEILAAARSAHPILLHGPTGSGRAFLGSLIASLRPTGRPWIRVVQTRGRGDDAVAAELFGSASTVGARELAEHAGGGAVVVREVQEMSLGLQQQMAAAVTGDLGAGFGAKVRWIFTAARLDAEGGADSGVAPALLELTKHHLIRVPSLQERREDLPLVIVRMLDLVAAEQGKDLSGIDLPTLDSLLTHGFGGEMAELLGELRRLVSATRSGETIRGAVRDEAAGQVLPAPPPGVDEGAVEVLREDDLKVVIPAVERMLIDRVLRRVRGNQSKAARELNLSRGALIAKIKEYDIPDYRALRRRSG